MPNQSGKIVLVLILLLLILGTSYYIFIPNNKKQDYLPSSTIDQGIDLTKKLSVALKKHISQDVKISFDYPQDWMIDDRYNEILIASFETSLNSNQVPSGKEIEIVIHNARGCHKTIDENLKDPSCGELGLNAKSYEILSKVVEEMGNSKYYKYLVKAPNTPEQRFYFLEEGERVVQIDKNPDPSIFDEEFEEIVKSIEFLD